ncbi:MAG: UDP-N-acetylmuramyl-tripeptide synthetase [Actinomycetaceae bacterium]|nr:UDP-N-acetylmuramyl-tripeptide synthetase [Actinomycetaceae bacterium]
MSVNSFMMPLHIDLRYRSNGNVRAEIVVSECQKKMYYNDAVLVDITLSTESMNTMADNPLRPATLHHHHVDALYEQCVRLDASATLTVVGPAQHTAAELNKESALATHATVRGATMDSRDVHPGDVFFAVPGTSFHGASFFYDVVTQGASCIITDHSGYDLITTLCDDKSQKDTLTSQVPIIIVSDVRDCLGTLSAWIYNNPTQNLQVVGITGTNGKTTATMILRQALQRLHRQCGLVGTIETISGSITRKSAFTTLEAPTLQQLAAHSVEAGDELLSIEVSSQGIAAQRLKGTRFRIVGFLNLQHDHLDFHGTMDNYFAAKASVFHPNYADKAVICLNDSWGRRLADITELDTLTYAIEGRCDAKETPDLDLWISSITRCPSSLSQYFMVHLRNGESFEASTTLPGEHNIENTVMAACCLIQLGYQPQEAFAACSTSIVIPGRLESITVPGLPKDAPRVYVDYAHTPEAVDTVLQTLRMHCRGQLQCIVGANGDRDKEKRPHMGYAAARHADIVHICDDTPYNDNPLEVRLAISQGIHQAINDGYDVSYDVMGIREDAIWQMIRDAHSDDCLVILGRGHEDLQVMHGYDHFFDDRLVAKRMLQRRYHLGTESGRLYDIPLYAAITDRDPRISDQNLLMSLSHAVKATRARLFFIRPDGKSTQDFFTLPAFSLLFGASIDSRQVTPSSLYVARTGETHDGHDFIASALRNGATAIMASNLHKAEEQISSVYRSIQQQVVPVLVVDDPTQALGALAAAHISAIRSYQQRFSTPMTVIGITGSAGKTTTKDLTVHLLSYMGKTIGPERSFNNEIGVPHTLLKAGCDTRYLVLEMGTSALGELRYLTKLAHLDIGVELMVGTAHLGGFGDVATLATAKAELVESLDSSSTAIFNADDPLVAAMKDSTRARPIFFSAKGTRQPYGVWAEDITISTNGCASFVLCYLKDNTSDPQRRTVKLRLVGAHHVNNALASAAIALHCGMNIDQLAEALESFEAVSAHRMAVYQRKDGICVIDDAYNANPDSMKAGLRALYHQAQAQGSRSVAILGEMLELGSQSRQWHEHVGKIAIECGCQCCIVVGKEALPLYECVRSSIESHYFDTAQEAQQEIDNLLRSGDTVLCKGSFGSRIWSIADYLCK